MTDELKVPRVADLNPRSGDYVSRLEIGLAGIDESLSRETMGAHALSGVFYRELVDGVKRIDGVNLRELPMFKDEIREGETAVASFSIDGVLLEYDKGKAKEVERALADLRTRTERAYQDRLRPYEDRITALVRAGEDFRDTITGLTEIKPLNDGVAQPTSAHFYFARGDEVYEAHVDLKEGTVVGPYRNQGLTARTFKDEEALAAFRRECEGVSANAYLIANPSSVIPVDVVFARGVDTTVSKIYEGRREETPDGLVGSLRNAVATFRKGKE